MGITAIKNVNILTMDKSHNIIENGVVIINDTIIVGIGYETLLQEFLPDTIIDGENGILLPGMINTHTHASMSVFRSLGDDIPNRLTKFLYPLEKELVDKDLVYAGAKYGIAEMLLGGVTTFADMYFFEEQVALAAHDMKIRAILGETVIDFPAPDSNKAYGGIEHSETFIKKWIDDVLITPAIAPHAPYSIDESHLNKCIKISERYQVPMIMHVAESEDEVAKFKKLYNMTPVGYLEKQGALNNRFIAAHLIHVNDEDLEILDNYEVGIAHNIGANTKGAKGVAPANKMYKRNLKIGLGTDGPMSGNTLDIITQMALVAKLHKLYNKDRSLFSSLEVVEIATLGGAKALHIEDIVGSIEVGKKADVVILETKSVNMQPIFDYYSVLVYSANPSNVHTVFVNGKMVVQNKKLINVSLKELQDNIKTYSKKVQRIADSI